MSTDDVKSTETASDSGRQAGAGVTVWLQKVLGAPRPSRATAPLLMPKAFDLHDAKGARFAIVPPAEVISSSDGVLQYLEIRDTPKEVTFTSGGVSKDGTWHVPPHGLEGLAACVPDDSVLPFSLTLKGVFTDDDADSTWVELAGITVGEAALETGATDKNDADVASGTELSKPTKSESATSAQPEREAGRGDSPPLQKMENKARSDEAEVEVSVPPPPQRVTLTPEKNSQPETLSIIDLDVSVGIEDPDELAAISVMFHGLPEGAALTTGTVDADGVWSVNATELKSLAVTFPEDTADFDMTVALDMGDGDLQEATIRVENESGRRPQSEEGVAIRLAPPMSAEPIRFKVFTDGTLAYDRVITWSGGKSRPVSLLVPYVPADSLPFEILMRFSPLTGGGKSAPVLMDVTIDGTLIPLESPAIAAHKFGDERGVMWRGDFVIDVRDALKYTEFESDDAVDGQPLEPEAEMVSGMEAPDEPMTESHRQQTPQTPQTGRDTAVAAPPTADDGVLVVQASFDDLRLPAFMEELRNLRRFIRAHTTGENKDVYDRLGIDVGKWRDMVVRGPTGAEVELDPLLPSLAVPGGRDNARALLPIDAPPVPSDAAYLKIFGLPVGAMLSRGENFGAGTWKVNAGDAERTGLLPALPTERVTTVRATWMTKNDEPIDPIGLSLLLGLPTLRPPATGMRTMSVELDPAVFDPDRHGALSLTLGELPPGILISGGSNHGDGIWTVNLGSGQPLDLTVAATAAAFELAVTCVAMNSRSGESTVASRRIAVSPITGRAQIVEDRAA